ncbi:MAG: hypothetical protein AVDCRST_MAG73-2089, partial [uncultured Thermomicrobiales bacterium]
DRNRAGDRDGVEQAGRGRPVPVGGDSGRGLEPVATGAEPGGHQHVLRPCHAPGRGGGVLDLARRGRVADGSGSVGGVRGRGGPGGAAGALRPLAGGRAADPGGPDQGRSGAAGGVGPEPDAGPGRILDRRRVPAARGRAHGRPRRAPADSAPTVGRGTGFWPEL